MLEYELQAQRLKQQASYQSDADPYRLAYEQCLRERRVDCDSGGMRATFYTAAFAPGRLFPMSALPFTRLATPMMPFARTVPFDSMVLRPAGHATRTAGHHGRSSRKF